MFAHLRFQVEFAPDLCSRVTFVNFTVTRSSLQDQCLNQVSLYKPFYCGIKNINKNHLGLKAEVCCMIRNVTFSKT